MAQRDNLLTVVAIGALAYIGQAVGHELLGHGGACILNGGHITALAPLWMHCSIDAVTMIVAGPAFNLIWGGLCALLMRLRRSADELDYFLWLSCAFNLLVLCGYLLVGGATTFGDWGVVFAPAHPQWVWRFALVAIGLGGYLFVVRALAALYGRLAASSGFERSTLNRRTLAPSAGAAAVACAAEIAGGRPAPGSLALAFGCTLFVGWSLSRMGDISHFAPPVEARPLCVPFRPGWVAAAVLASVLFVCLVG